MSIAGPVVSSRILVSADRIARALKISPKTLRKMSARGDFPKPVDLGFRKTVYLLAEVDAWWKTRLGGLNGDPFPLPPDSDDDQ